ncbi:MAG: rhodanese-like domain-containing protein [Myxococcales bacterium]|nr:rhodanese-like domain-containing protein [Myxococcales bacterium]MDH5306261.1 rhodanese-like domain-containing protein [Myxococcales bacterium]MDH5566236.1 rhodanese-like domain-containing protein [Myxococcales bacterium]
MAKQSEWDISVEELESLRTAGASIRLLDVREPHEYEICNLEGELVPLGRLAQQLDSLDRSAHIVVHCRSGGRSAKAVGLMRAAGFENVWNVNGGILAWIERIDPTLTRY